MRRRTFLASMSSAIVLAVGLLFINRRTLKARVLSSSLRRRARESILGVDSSVGTSTLTGEEEARLCKLAGAVLPSDAGPQAWTIVLDRLRWRAATGPGFASEFRRALAFLDQEAKRKHGEQSGFGQLTNSEVAVVVGALLDGVVGHDLSATSRKDVLRLATSSHFRSQYRMRRHVVNEILDGYYRSPLAWRRLGYRSFPGACAGIVIYSQPPGQS